jgi:type II secretory pathway component PulJ
MPDGNMWLMAALRRLRSDSAGFSLPEIMITTAISLAACATFLSFSNFQLAALRNQADQLDMQTAGRSIVDLFAREVRRAGRNPTCAGTFAAIAEATSYRLRIQSDLNGSGTIDGHNEDITYGFNTYSRAITRLADGVTDELVSGIDPTGSRLRYFDAAGSELIPVWALTQAQRNSVRRVRLELTVRSGATRYGRSAPLQTQVSTDVDLRNRFFVAKTGCP